MGRTRNRGSSSGVAGALVIGGVGVILLLHENGIIRWQDIWRLWPLQLVAAGFVRLGQYAPHNCP